LLQFLKRKDTRLSEQRLVEADARKNSNPIEMRLHTN
jgi:hypothetical protein